MMGNEIDFISKMVQETLDGEQVDHVVDVNFLRSAHVEIMANYDAKLRCYVIRNEHNKVLQIPENWGPFKNRIATEFIVSRQDDNYLFLDILSEFCEQNIDNLKVCIEIRDDRVKLRKAA